MRLGASAALGVALLLGGCEHEVFSQHCAAERAAPPCLAAADDASETLLLERFASLYDADCPYRFQYRLHRTHTCSNPTVKSVGADFDGYARVTVFFEGTCYWRAQSDFKTDEAGATDRLMERMASELLAQ